MLIIVMLVVLTIVYVTCSHLLNMISKRAFSFILFLKILKFWNVEYFMFAISIFKKIKIEAIIFWDFYTKKQRKNVF